MKLVFNMKHRNIPYKYLEWTTFKGEKASGYLCKYFNFSPWYVDVLPAQTEAEMHKKINECLDNRAVFESIRKLSDASAAAYYKDTTRYQGD